MDQNYELPGSGISSFDERFAALEHQCYLMYLQLNSITQLLVDAGTLKKEDIGTLMDKMHSEIEKAVNEIESATNEEHPSAE